MSLLSRARLLFIAKHAERFTNKIFVELRGESDEAGFSPFWNALGKHFFSMDFQKADYLSGVSNKHFIADLMPRYPIYIPTLPDIAQQVIGVVHETSENVSQILLKEGFCFRDYVDVFDAGPTIEARQQDINTIVNSQTSSYQLSSTSLKEQDAYLIASGELEQFRVTLANGLLSSKHRGLGSNNAESSNNERQSLTIQSDTHALLNLSEQEQIQWIQI